MGRYGNPKDKNEISKAINGIERVRNGDLGKRNEDLKVINESSPVTNGVRVVINGYQNETNALCMCLMAVGTFEMRIEWEETRTIERYMGCRLT